MTLGQGEEIASISCPKSGMLNLDECFCGEGSHPLRHIFMQYLLYIDFKETFLSGISLTDLGNSTDYETIVSHSQAIRYVEEFILDTGPLGQSRQVEVQPLPIDDEKNESG